MSTGIEAWKSLSEIGPLYPFVGTEVMWVIIGVVLWIVWHVLQISHEKDHHNEAKSHFRKNYKG